MALHPLLRARLSIVDAPSSVARVSIENGSRAQPTHLLRYNLGHDGALVNNVFFSKPPAARLRYLGLYTRRRPRMDEVLELAPGATVSFEVELARFYELRQGEPVEIAYEAFHDLPDRSEVLLVRSNPVIVQV
jgi:hypothetical protein